MVIDVRQPALCMTWEDDTLVLSLAPLQGRWTAEQYLLLTDSGRRLLAACAEAARRVDEEVAAGLDPGQRDDLRLLLAKVSDTLAP